MGCDMKIVLIVVLLSLWLALVHYAIAGGLL